MCGIVCAFELKRPAEEVRPQVLQMVKKLRHRGPDWSGIETYDNAVLAHERLAIVDPMSGKQPLLSRENDMALAANGEIYNHKELARDLDFEPRTASDCEVILALYEQHDVKFLDKLNGIFGFALYDVKKDQYLITRDHMGIIPLYVGWDEHGILYVASELKALSGVCNQIEVVPPGHYMTSDTDGFQAWYQPEWKSYDSVKDHPTVI